MSYQGFEGWLCTNGHYHQYDCHYTSDKATWRCPNCTAGLAAWQSFDCTNGCDICPDSKEINDTCGSEDLKVSKSAITKVCPTCFTLKTSMPIAYHIPEDWNTHQE